jgi:hypothetical protein
MAAMAAIDMFVVATATFRLLYAMIVLDHNRRRAVHFEATENDPILARASDHRGLSLGHHASPSATRPRYVIRRRPSRIVSEQWARRRSSPHSAQSVMSVSSTLSCSVRGICILSGYFRYYNDASYYPTFLCA